MICKPTVFVLGAGASCAYGFPSGASLVRTATKCLWPDSQDSLKRDLSTLGFSATHQEHFAVELQDSHCGSIDAFLEARTEFLELGRVVIASLVTTKERPAIFSQSIADDWFGYLFDLLRGSTPGAFRENNVTVVTFNYDRSFEFALHSALRASFGLANADASELCHAIPVVHLHGSLDALPEYPTLGTPKQPRPFGATPAEIQTTARGVKIITEADADSEEFQFARKQIRGAEIICFLGFGYAAQNFSRLGIPDLLVRASRVKVMGSAFEMTPAETRRVWGRPIRFGKEDQACREFLRRHWLD